MAKIHVAGRTIEGLVGDLGFGHLLLVFDGPNGKEKIEVLGPDDLGVLDNWVYVKEERYTPPNESDDYATSQKIDLGDRDATEVWTLLGAIHDKFLADGDFEYNSIIPSASSWQNSNSYINTLLYMIGIDLADYRADARPVNVDNDLGDGFPGWQTNVILNPNEVCLRARSLTLVLRQRYQRSYRRVPNRRLAS